MFAIPSCLRSPVTGYDTHYWVVGQKVGGCCRPRLPVRGWAGSGNTWKSCLVGVVRYFVLLSSMPHNRH